LDADGGACAVLKRLSPVHSAIGRWCCSCDRTKAAAALLLRHPPIHRLHELDERSQLARRVGAIRIVEMKRLVWRQKCVEYRNDGTRGDLGGRELSEDEAEPAALTRRAEHGAHLVENESAAHVDRDVLAADTKFPFEEPRAIQAMTD